MEIIFVLLPLALALAFIFLAAYIWAVRSGQFDDTTTPAYRILLEDEKKKAAETDKKDVSLFPEDPRSPKS